MNFMLEADTSNTIISLILIGILAIFLIFIFISNNKKKAQYMQEMKRTQSKFVAGAKVKTYAGFYGEIVSVRTALDGTSVVTLKVGEGDKIVHIEMDINYISNIDDKDNKEVFDDEYEKLMNEENNLNERMYEANQIEQEPKEEIKSSRKTKSTNKNEK